MNIEEYYIKNYPWSSNKFTYKYIEYDRQDFVLLCIELWTLKNVADFLEGNRRALGHKIYKEFPELTDRCVGTPLGYKFLTLLDLKKCPTCTRILIKNQDFPSMQSSKDGYHALCKKCETLRNTTKKLKKLQRTPSWANKEKITKFYIKCPKDHHVDHIIPLQGEKVSGLHVVENLQYLTASENLSKSNKFDVEKNNS